VKAFWSRLVYEWAHGVVDSAVWVGFSLEQLVSLQSELINPCTLPQLVPSRRLSFRQRPEAAAQAMFKRARALDEAGFIQRASAMRDKAERLATAPNGPPVPADQPTHGNYLTLLPSPEPELGRAQLEMWAARGRELGEVRA
jgi:hypothetical protein